MLSKPPLTWLSMLHDPMKLATFYNLPPVVKLQSQGGPSNISRGVIHKIMDGDRRNINPSALNKQCGGLILFGESRSPIQRTSETRNIAGIKFSNNLLSIRLETPSNSLYPMGGEQFLHIRNCVKIYCKNSTLDYLQPIHNPLVLSHLGIPVDLILTI